jgi:hypothetical protein
LKNSPPVLKVELADVVLQREIDIAPLPHHAKAVVMPVYGTHNLPEELRGLVLAGEEHMGQVVDRDRFQTVGLKETARPLLALQYQHVVDAAAFQAPRRGKSRQAAAQDQDRDSPAHLVWLACGPDRI